ESPTGAETTVAAGASVPTGNLARQSLQRLPLATAKVDEALPLIPGVIRSSTGEISIKGASEQQSSLVINGFNSGDPASGNFRLNLPIDAVEAVQVFQHPYTAEYGNFTGGVTQIMTRRGGDKFHFELNDFLPDFRFVGGKIVGVQDNSPHLNFNGPIIKDRLFISQSAAYTISKTPVRGLVFPVNETITESQSYFTQLDFIPNERRSETFTFGYFPERDRFVGLDFFRPQPVTPNYKQKDFVVSLRDNWVLGGGLLQSSVSFKQFNAHIYGQGTNDQILTPTVEQGNYFATQDRRSHRFELLEIYDLPALRLGYGQHNFKVGFDFNEASNRLDYQANPVEVRRADGTLAERLTFDRAPLNEGRNHTYSAFAQDRWLVRPNLSFDLGLRYENQSIAQQQNFAPRAGFAFSPFKNDKTVIRGGVGVFYDKVPLNIRSFDKYPARTVMTYAANGVSILDRQRFVNVLIAQNPIPPLDFSRSNENAGFVPRNLTWNLQIDQTINKMLGLRANLISSHTNNIYIVNPELDFQGRNAIVLRSAGEAKYRALELTARFFLNNKNTFYLSYVRSRSKGDLNDFNSYFGDFGTPLIRQNQYSNLPTSVPNRFLAWGTFNLPHKIFVSPILEARNGFPYSVRDGQQNFVGTRNAGNTRFPTFFALDAEFGKDFQITKKYAVRLSIRAFNLTDHFNPRDVRANLADPQFGQFFAPYRRYFTGGFDILF
ncbi:MAG: TonB-dependent receptor, partial [Acidobacteriota bacterium]